ncbi:MAG: GNAT family N-acetyltransferase [Myxococcales bacterium]|nr:GNAT family N-acetyltransferase [Myxococcales bacterium]
MLHLRDARDDDADALIRLIGDVFAEYPGCVMDADGELPELLQIASYFRDHDGEFWVAERDGLVVGCIGYSPAADPAGIELKKLYVQASERKSGLGGMLVERVEARARERGARFIDLWSDTRFVTAHAFYERRGWKRGPTTRELHDKSYTVEFYFRRELTP